MEKYLTPHTPLPPLAAPRCTTIPSMHPCSKARRGRGDGALGTGVRHQSSECWECFPALWSIPVVPECCRGKQAMPSPSLCPVGVMVFACRGCCAAKGEVSPREVWAGRCWVILRAAWLLWVLWGLCGAGGAHRGVRSQCSSGGERKVELQTPGAECHSRAIGLYLKEMLSLAWQ